MRSYPCKVVGIAYEGRYDYIIAQVRERDELRLMPEPDNEFDDRAVAVYHRRTKIGYIPSNKLWVSKSLEEGDTHTVLAEELVYNDDDEPTALAITIWITSDGQEANASPPRIRRAGLDRLPEAKPPRSRLGFGSFLLLIFAGVWLLSQGLPKPTPGPTAPTPSPISPQPNQPAGLPAKLREALGPAPAGKEAAVALRIIQDNFDAGVCSKVTAARRFDDGSIKAKCSSGEDFRIFTLNGKSMAMRCSAVIKLGATSC